MFFSYKSKTKTGEVVEGVLYAMDRFSLARDLRSRGQTPLSITEKGKSLFDRLSAIEDRFSKVSVPEKIILTKNLSGMLKAGLSLARALSVLGKQTKNPKLKKILSSISDDINAGETLSVALSKFPDIFSKL